MKKTLTTFLLVLGVTSITSIVSAVPFINIVDNPGGSFFDVFYTPDTGSEFNAWDLIVTPQSGGLLDPDQAAREADVSGGAPVDTFVNTVFSSLGAGAASHIFTEYNPGSAFPPVPADSLPTVGGTPSILSWTVFDTAAGDGAIDGFTPYHMARVLYTQGGSGTVDVAFFETATLDTPLPASGTYGGTTVPEPTTLALAGLSLIGLLGSRRRRS